MAPRPHYLAPGVKTMDDSMLKLYPRDLNIIWGNDQRYWRLPPQSFNGSNESNPTVAAELVQVCWLEVNGTVKVKPGKYKISFSVSLNADSFGWNACKPFVMAKGGKGGSYLNKPAKISMSKEPGEIFIIPREAELIINVEAKEGSDRELLYFGLYEVWSGKWKGGLKIHHATIEKVQ